MHINLFTNGDCTNINTWSGLPYYFYRSLCNQGLGVTPLNLAPVGRTEAVLRRALNARARLIRLVRPDYRYEMLRSRLHHAVVNRKLRFMTRRHRDADLNVFLTFTFSSRRFVRVPVVHFCDITYEHHLEEIGRAPTRNDRAFIEIDRQNIENADLVLTTGQACLDFITSRYRPKRAFCLRTGNSTDADVPDPERLLTEKEHSKNILFIGRGAHSRGADILIQSFKLFNERRDNAFTLNIVGVNPNELPEPLRAPDPNVRFHGYLDRNIPADLALYNGLIASAKMFVMPRRSGPFPGVIREALLHCTPAIVSSVSPEILMHERESLLVDSLDPAAFAQSMDRLVDDPVLWRRLALNGHQARSRYPWSSTAEKFVDIVNDCGLLKNRADASSSGNLPVCTPRS
jgi:glycosyltransferase involved in cell wall biosynthesis